MDYKYQEHAEDEPATFILKGNPDRPKLPPLEVEAYQDKYDVNFRINGELVFWLHDGEIHRTSGLQQERFLGLCLNANGQIAFACEDCV